MMRVSIQPSVLAETAIFSGGGDCASLTARVAFQEALHGRASILDLRSGSERAVEGELPAYLSTGGAEGHRRLIALVGSDGFTMGLPAISGGFAAWRHAGMPVAAS